MKLKNIYKHLKRYIKLHKEIKISFTQFANMRSMSDFRIYDVLSMPSDEQIIEHTAKLMTERLGMSHLEAVERLHHVHEITGVPYDFIVSRSLYKLDDDELIKSGEIYGFSPIEDYIEKYAQANNLSRDEVQAKYDKIYKISRLSQFVVYTRKYFSLPMAKVRANIKKRDEKEYNKIKEIAKKLNMSVFEYMCDEKLKTIVLGERNDYYKLFGHPYMSYEESKTYLTYNDMYFLMRKYNVSPNIKFFNSKGLFYDVFGEYTGRKMITLNDKSDIEELRGFIESNEYSKIIVKPINADSGKGIKSFVIDNNLEEIFKNIKVIIKKYGEAIVENFVVQHPKMCKLGGGCVNTIRALTILENDKVDLLYAVLRVGASETVDNFSAGGYLMKLDLDNGIVVTPGYNKMGEIFEKDISTGEVLKDFSVPYWNDVRKLLEEAARKLPDVGFIGWDIAITEDGPILIEANHNPLFCMIEFSHAGVHKGMRHIAKNYLREN